MKDDLKIKNGIVIPKHELEFTASRAGGPGGQHVNKASTKITIRWNVKNTQALNPEQKQRVLERLVHQLTTEGDLIIHSSSSRSQQQNKDMGLKKLAQTIRKALVVPRKRIATQVPQGVQEKRLQEKKRRSEKLKQRKIWDE